ncbi:MAG: glycosyltransferase family 2 protein [Oscillibacter sp.]
MQTVITINAVIMALFFVCYSYQFFYVAVALLKRKKFTCRNENHRIAVLIAARNEENVIGQLIDSIHAQKNYPMDHVDIYVGADNCTDDTARVARERGAIVFERHDTVHVGKGYVLNEMLKRIKRTGRKHYDAYLVLDADNILDPNFISEIEKVYSGGYEIVTCYRNSKNYGDNWISAGYALWFLREAQYLNNARMRLEALRRVRHRLSVFRRCAGSVRRLELLPADRGHRVYH